MDENAKARAQELVKDIKDSAKELVKVFKNAQNYGKDSEGLHLLRHATAQSALMDLTSAIETLQGCLLLENKHEALIRKYSGKSFYDAAIEKTAEMAGKIAQDEALDSLVDTMVQEINKRPDEDPFADLMNTLNRRRNSQF